MFKVEPIDPALPNQFKVLHVNTDKFTKTYNLITAILESRFYKVKPFKTERSGTDAFYIFQDEEDARFVHKIMSLYEYAVSIVDKDMSLFDEAMNEIESM